MRTSFAAGLCFALFALVLAPVAFGDTLVFSNGRVMTGKVVCTNGEDVLVVTDCAAFNFWRGSIKEIKPESADAEAMHNTNAIPPFRVAVMAVAKQPWASGLQAIPATVIDKGVLRNVPYTSFRCGDDYEMNIYGDPRQPAGFEIGVYRKLLEDPSAKQNCISLAAELLGKAEDRQTVLNLNKEKDIQAKNGRRHSSWKAT